MHNAEKTGTTWGVTKFADMTHEEFRKYPCGVDKLSDLSGKRPDFQPILGELPQVASDLPDNWDWTQHGAVTPVKDQGQCGSCWAFSTVGNIEGVWEIAGNQLTGLSEQQEVDCSKTSYGCQGGWPFWAMSDMLQSPYNGRIDTEQGYPYTAEDGNCAFSTNYVGATIKAYKNYCNEQTAPCTEDQMAQLLYQTGPLSACLDANNMQYYQGGIDSGDNCDPSYIDHCITIVGYGVTQNGTEFWKIKNSWGTSWGESGYYYLEKGKGACGINVAITVAQV